MYKTLFLLFRHFAFFAFFYSTFDFEEINLNEETIFDFICK